MSDYQIITIVIDIITLVLTAFAIGITINKKK